MGNSPLVSFTKISPNKNSPRNHVIDTITIHCTAGQMTAESLGAWFAKTSTQASSNYGVDKDGRIGLYVEEGDRSWCSSSPSNDHRAITIEVSSDSFHPYKVTDKALASLIDLCADICKRNGIKALKWKGDPSLIGQVEKQNMTVHRWFANKPCPGEYLYNLHGYIANEVNKRLAPKTLSAWEKEVNEACDWAVSQGISDGKRLDEPLLRKEAIVMLYRSQK
ncbi:MAG: peptidoglycan recognition family protein [Bacillota bacterium]|nr:peptidoglycan recognition family protein [Bacillota bacterium]